MNEACDSCNMNNIAALYRITANFRGIEFLRIDLLQIFADWPAANFRGFAFPVSTRNDLR